MHLRSTQAEMHGNGRLRGRENRVELLAIVVEELRSTAFTSLEEDARFTCFVTLSIYFRWYLKLHFEIVMFLTARALILLLIII